jgi:hypothetical protein
MTSQTELPAVNHACAMPARETEAALLARCCAVARQAAEQTAEEVAPSAQDPREANVFRLAAMVLQSRFPGESMHLMQASERYFDSHPNEKLAPADVVRKGWVLSLPRLRDMLSHSLCDRGPAHEQLSVQAMLEMNLREAVALARKVESERSAGPPCGR